MTKRIDYWLEAYARTLEEMRNEPFVWGTHDCIIFVARLLTAITDRDFVSEMRAKYQWTSEAEARATIAGRGGLESFVTEFLGEPLPSPHYAGQGDVVLVDAPDDSEIAMICDGNMLIGPGAEELMFLRRAHAKKAWRVG